MVVTRLMIAAIHTLKTAAYRVAAYTFHMFDKNFKGKALSILSYSRGLSSLDGI